MAWLPPAQTRQIPGEEAGGGSTILKLLLMRVFPPCNDFSDESGISDDCNFYSQSSGGGRCVLH